MHLFCASFWAQFACIPESRAVYNWNEISSMLIDSEARNLFSIPRWLFAKLNIRRTVTNVIAYRPILFIPERKRERERKSVLAKNAPTYYYCSASERPFRPFFAEMCEICVENCPYLWKSIHPTLCEKIKRKCVLPIKVINKSTIFIHALQQRPYVTQ